MPRYTKDGTCIFPASEVAEFTVCPKAWSLKRLHGHVTLGSEDVDRGDEVHQSWANDLEFGFTIGRLIRVVCALMASATVALLLIAEKL